jgi:DNA-binding transcriptional MerR regulator
MSEPWTLNELAEEADVTPRTVRYYIQHGLLPPPIGAGPGPHYERGHLDRILLIKRLKKAHLPLAEIRQQLSGLDDEAVRGLTEEPAEPLPESAADYVRTVLAEGPAPYVAELRAAMPETPEPTVQRSQWERIALDPDVEVHVRRPLSRAKNRALHELLDRARTLFGDTEER